MTQQTRFGLLLCVFSFALLAAAIAAVHINHAIIGLALSAFSGMTWAIAWRFLP